MNRNLEILKTSWVGEHVYVNKEQDDFNAGVITDIEWVLEADAYRTGPKIGIHFVPDSDGDRDYVVYLPATLTIEKDPRY